MGQIMYSLLSLLHSVVIYCYKCQIVYKRFTGERVTSVGYKVSGITAETSGVAVEAVELTMVIEENGRELVAFPTVPLVCFPIQGSVYSSVSLRTKH